MQEKLRHDVTTTTSRRSDSYVGTQFQEHPAHYQVSLISIFGDKKTKKGAILNVKPLFCSVVAPSVPMNRTMKPVSKDIETGFIFYSRILRSLVYVGMESRHGCSAYRLRRGSDARNRDRNLRVGMNHTYGYRDTSSYPS